MYGVGGQVTSSRIIANRRNCLENHIQFNSPRTVLQHQTPTQTVHCPPASSQTQHQIRLIERADQVARGQWTHTIALNSAPHGIIQSIPVNIWWKSTSVWSVTTCANANPCVQVREFYIDQTAMLLARFGYEDR